MAVPCSAVLETAVPCSAVPSSAVLETAVPSAAVHRMSVQLSGSGHSMEVIRHLTCGWRCLPAHLSCGWRGPPGLQYRACGCPPAHLAWGLRGPPGLKYWACGCPPAHLGWGWRGPPGQLGCWQTCRACCPSQPSLFACGPSPPLAVCQVAPHFLPEPW
ncbi:hypothetical protein NDU88_005226 [Pleurodeles waltl]|uniref:Uncharacterized protein n=1 Tax=Pleurodeles waltl TaxID=8319 RepID=A0AAV7PI97_PLEWA|nr:hypothetical protein NDU88_005226 [Pleurodeles waltl]